MSKLLSALALQIRGFHVFPLLPGLKRPSKAMRGYPSKASLDPGDALRWWTEDPNANIGISTSAFADDGRFLLAFDVDTKRGKPGDTTMLAMISLGYVFPPTCEQRTPTGGQHLIYWTRQMMRSTVQEFGSELYQGSQVSGVDTRGKGGLIVGAGSTAAGKTDQPYLINSAAVAEAEPWMVRMFVWTGHDAGPDVDTSQIDQELALERATSWLLDQPAVSEGRNNELYLIATQVKDFGITESDCAALILEHWKAEPPLETGETIRTVRNAYKYGQNKTGSLSPAALFTSHGNVDDGGSVRGGAANDAEARPLVTDDDDTGAGVAAIVADINRRYAFALVGNSGCILFESKDRKGRFKLKTLSVDTFKNKIAGEKLYGGTGKPQERWKLWLYHRNRRSYDDLVFAPAQEVDPRFYNLWRGFAYKPLATGEIPSDTARRALDSLLEHIHENAAFGNQKHAHWMLSWFAHSIQKPDEKPTTSIVFRGGKGIGKDTLVRRFGALHGDHFMATAKRRFLTGQFNAHLENKLMFLLNEAFWAHDQKIIGVLNELASDPDHYVERKGIEAYYTDNLIRLIIVGNADTLVPASFDERRWAVFDVRAGPSHTKRDPAERRAFFREMRTNFELDGYPLLMRYLMQYDISNADINGIPETDGLYDQKLACMSSFQQWWMDCLTNGRIMCCDFSAGWPERIDKETFRAAFRRWMRERKPDEREIHEVIFGRRLKECVPSLITTQKTSSGANAYDFPKLEVARAEWDTFIGHKRSW